MATWVLLPTHNHNNCTFLAIVLFISSMFYHVALWRIQKSKMCPHSPACLAPPSDSNWHLCVPVFWSDVVWQAASVSTLHLNDSAKSELTPGNQESEANESKHQFGSQEWMNTSITWQDDPNKQYKADKDHKYMIRFHNIQYIHLDWWICDPEQTVQHWSVTRLECMSECACVCVDVSCSQR